MHSPTAFGLNDKRTGMFMISGSLVLIYLFGELMLDWNFPVLFAAISYAVAEGLKTESAVSTKNGSWRRE